MTRGPIILAEGVGKAFGRRTLRAFLAPRGSRVRSDRDAQTVALDEIDLVLHQGESLGVIGRNGAGKSTLLRLVAGLARPSWGRLEVRGEVRSLLDLGAGFVEDMSGRDDAISLLGVDGVPAARRAEVAAQAIAFAEIGAFADEPVRAYSSGMRLRLAYALAVSHRTELLVTDEVLSVGDEDFQRRCATHVSRFLGDGGSLLLASHNLYHVEKLCQRAIWLDRGHIRAHGPARHVTAAYRAEVEEALAAEGSARPDLVEETRHPIAGSHREEELAAPAAIEIRTGDGAGVRRIAEGERVEIWLESATGMPAHGDVAIHRAGTRVATIRLPHGRATIESWPLLPGRYRLQIADATGAGRGASGGIEVETLGTSRDFGTLRLEHAWS